MSSRKFSLLPFSADDALPDIKVTGRIEKRNRTIAALFELSGSLSQLAIPAPAETAERRDRLWEETCFELFICPEGSECYWELNLSPSGHWNAYRFSSYRQGMREERAFPSLPFRVRRDAAALLVALELDLERMSLAGNILDIGISTVIKNTDGRISYWALTHIGNHPDFHRKESFTIKI